MSPEILLEISPYILLKYWLKYIWNIFLYVLWNIRWNVFRNISCNAFSEITYEILVSAFADIFFEVLPETQLTSGHFAPRWSVFHDPFFWQARTRLLTISSFSPSGNAKKRARDPKPSLRKDLGAFARVSLCHCRVSFTFAFKRRYQIGGCVLTLEPKRERVHGVGFPAARSVWRGELRTPPRNSAWC